MIYIKRSNDASRIFSAPNIIRPLLSDIVTIWKTVSHDYKNTYVPK